MTTWLYCVLAPPRPELFPRGLAGLDDAPVRALSAGGLEAWVSTVSHAIAADVDHTRAHNDVVEAAMSTGRTPLPARFGQRFPDDAACLTDIASRQASLEAAVSRVAGAVEMSVLLVAREPAAAPVAVDASPSDTSLPGHRYLDAVRARAAVEQRQRARVLEQIAAIQDSVRSLVRASSPPEIGRGRVTGSIAHLVTPAHVAAYRTAAMASDVAPEFRMVIAGPRAPYSFCSADANDPGTILAT